MALRQQCPLREKIANVQLSPKPNLLFIVSDQLRFDAIRIVQDSLPLYDGYTKVRTPNIDRLARMGVLFDTAYCVSPSCAPARTALKTGNSLQRSAIKGNQMISRQVYSKMDWIEQRIMKLETLEQMLVENETYTAATFGKWHTPLQLYYRRGDSKQQIPDITSNVYSFEHDEFRFKREQHFRPVYVKQLKYLTERDGVHPEISGRHIVVRITERVLLALVLP
jgi:arylsulfatase A-like enzyme